MSDSNKIIDPELLFEEAQLRSGMHIADLGCGRTGHIVFPAVKYVGETGLVYAVDIMKDVLENIKKRAALENLLNIQTVWSNLEMFGKTAIPTKSLDIGFLINMLWQTADRFAVLAEANRLLRDKARLVVVDWLKDGLPFGPRHEQFINFSEIETWGRNHGFVNQEGFTMGNYLQGVVLYKHD
jgi:ubiquinone/menaquinone biosynthesis C-methylase UbiE